MHVGRPIAGQGLDTDEGKLYHSSPEWLIGRIWYTTRGNTSKDFSEESPHRNFHRKILWDGCTRDRGDWV
jgi:hypothetical protein